MIPLTARRGRGARARASSRPRPGRTQVTGVQTDSRRVERGRPLRRGRAAARTSSSTRSRAAPPPRSSPTTPSPRSPRSPARVRERSGARFVAITGSMGKTSTKDILAAICAPQRRTVAAERSYNNEIGVPLTICRVEPDTELCILELAHARASARSPSCARSRGPDVGVITTIGPVHLEKVGDLDGCRPREERADRGAAAGGTAVVPADFPVGRDDLERRTRRRGRDARVLRPAACSATLARRRRGRASRPATSPRTRSPRSPRRTRSASTSPDRLDVEFTDWRNQELAAPRRRRPDQRRLERQPALDARRARAPRRSSPPAAARSRCSATWRSSAPTARRATVRSRVPLEELAIDEVVAIGPRRAAYGGRHVDDGRRRRSRSLRRGAPARRLSCSSRAHG